MELKMRLLDEKFFLIELFLSLSDFVWILTIKFSYEFVKRYRDMFCRLTNDINYFFSLFIFAQSSGFSLCKQLTFNIHT